MNSKPRKSLRTCSVYSVYSVVVSEVLFGLEGAQGFDALKDGRMGIF